MEVLTLDVETEDFWFNFWQLKNSYQLPVPFDTFQYICDCGEKVNVFPNGEFFCEEKIASISSLISSEKMKGLEKHMEKTKCIKGNLKVDEDLGIPNNIILLVKNNDKDIIQPVFIELREFIPILIVEKQNQPVLVLFQNKETSANIYSRLISNNFDTHLNIPNQNEANIEDLDDDEDVNKLQHLLPRLTGGGRKVMQDFKYICQWCSPEILMKKNRGRFREIKNYRDHFRRCHQDIPFSEFLNKVERDEPKWQCKICRQKLSLGNQLRHQVICRPQNYESTSSSSEEDEMSDENEGKDDKVEEQSKDFNYQVEERRGESSNSDSSDIAPPKKLIKRKAVSSSSSDQEEEGVDVSNEGSAIHKEIHSSVSEFIGRITQQNMIDVALSNEPENHEKLDFDGTRITVDSEINHSNVDDYYSFEDDNEEEDVPEENVISIAAESGVLSKDGNSTSDTSKVDAQNQVKIIKWWQGISKDFVNVQGCPLDIFLPDDEEEFIKVVVENYKRHQLTKKDLDKRMLDIENSDEKYYQFSQTRDQPFVDEYLEYVKNFSTKDILNILSSEGEESGQQKGATATTAKQYSYRIIELFHFLKQSYKGFHLDWFLDYSNHIEKTLQDQVISTDIFIPPKSVFADFIKSFMYGSNPAANCGIRIFALKKLFDFLVKKFKDNEHLFRGTIVERTNLIECLTSKLKGISSDLCPAGTVKHISIASNRNHRKILAEQLKKCPEKSSERIMQGVKEYLVSEEYTIQKQKLFTLAYDSTKIPNAHEYIDSTKWLLEQLICIGGNRPCALLGLTVGDWQQRKPGYCPFDQSDENDLIEDDPSSDTRKVLKDPFQKPIGSDDEEPTGVIVKSDTDKVTIGPPCYIWFPNELEDLVQAHCLLSSKYFSSKVDVNHPKSLLFYNSRGNAIKTIECKHFKEFIGLPIIAYDFRRSLATFCLQSSNENIRKSEPSVLRHRSETGYAYYYQKHSLNVEYVNIQYAVQHGLVKANEDEVNNNLANLKANAFNDEWELSQKRTDMALQYSKELMEKEQQSINDSQAKTGRKMILANEYTSFMNAIIEAINFEEDIKNNLSETGPHSQLLKYRPGEVNAGCFPPNSVWWKDMCRVLFGLVGPIGDEMRKADLSVYDGVAFAEVTGRKKINEKPNKCEYVVSANYWRDKIIEENKAIKRKNVDQIRFIFNKSDLDYFKSKE